jgi:microcin C transport system permease protein
MIEKFIKNEDTLKQWRRFKSRRLAVISCWVVGLACLFSFTAEFWANSKPLLLKYNDSIYYPVVKNYHPSIFGDEESLVVNYRDLELDEDRGDFAIWPIIQWDPYESNKEVESYPSEPSAENWMGTDDRGRDILTRLLYGLRYSISFAVLVWLLTFIVGTVLGGIMGYFGGRVDFWGQRIVEILSTVPQFFLLIIIISIFKPTLLLLVLLSSIFGWISISYYVRGEYLKNRKKELEEIYGLNLMQIKKSTK